MTKSAYTNSYYYFSTHSISHEINSNRLNAVCFKVSTESNVLDDIPHNSFLYLASDILLLDNSVTHSLSNSDLEVFITHKAIDDTHLRQFCGTNLSVSLPDTGSIALIRLTPSGAEKLARNFADNLCVEVIDKNVPISTQTFSKTSAFSTKARTLRFFEGLISATIDSGVIVKHKDWTTSRKQLIDNILQRNWLDVIVRSSSINEDGFNQSNAGAFDSYTDISGSDKKALEVSIDAVFSSFDKLAADDEVFLQAQLKKPRSSGVCTTRVIGKNSPYYVINYDDESDRTDSVTAGDTNSIKTLLVYRLSKIEDLEIDQDLKNLLFAIKEIEYISKDIALDIEFVITSEGQVNIVQIRPLVGSYSFSDDIDIEKMMVSSRALYAQYAITNDGINLGNQPIFGVMPDANPAELIGIKPKPLAFSLYRYLITDDVVTNQRHEYGYRDVRPYRHMVKIGGSPYINVRSSFNSFTPCDIDSATVEKMINCYLGKLFKDTSLHDKVEFDVVATTWFPGINEWFAKNYGDQLSHHEIVKSITALKKIFQNALLSFTQYEDDIKKYQPLFTQTMDSDQSDLQKACTLIDICHHFGCKPFAHLARSGFIAVSVLKGFLNCKVISKDQYNNYLQSIESVSSKMESDASLVNRGQMPRGEFYDLYGHLRPGTYDICSEAYFENPDKYLGPIIESANSTDKNSTVFDTDTINRIEDYFSSADINISFLTFDTFSRAAISGREYGKFQYTRFLSHGLNYLLKWGGENGFSRNDIAYLTITDIQDILTGAIPYNMKNISELIAKRNLHYNLEAKIELPDIIKSASDFNCFYKQADKPNFITGASIRGSLKILTSSSEILPEQLENRIVLINSADPGFDWLFGCSIAGLITKYGGANSHMAIRCAELNIPAAIGVGDILYNKLVGYKNIDLNCIDGTIKEV